jgi:hypothetical protein
MVRTFFDIKPIEAANPRPAWVKEDDPWNPFSPRREVIKAFEEVNFKYEFNGQDRGASIWYGLVKGRPEKITQEITQMYRRRIPTEGEFIFYNVLLRGEDWKGNEHDLPLIMGRYELPIFKREKDPATDKVSTTEIIDHRTKYDIPWSVETFDKLADSFVEPISLIVYGSAGRRLGITSLEDFRNGSIDDLIQCGTKGKSLDSVIAERNQFYYEKRELKDKFAKIDNANTTAEDITPKKI